VSQPAGGGGNLSFFDAYGASAAHINDPTVAVGRYPFQAADEQNILPDVVAKLGPQPRDRLLEIGFGTGLLFLPLAGMVREATGVDHSLSVARLAGHVPANVSLVAARWPDTDPLGEFDRILAYSVLHYVEGRAAAERFIEACVEALADGGILLIGDLPNEDAKQRFAESAFGQRFIASWTRQVAECDDEEQLRFDQIVEGVTRTAPFIDDEFILTTIATYRSSGLGAYTLPQRAGLPFCHTREDLLIRRPAA
jgi:SAM-dependent methyltransferase